jgi:hypothetical protein
VNKKMLKKFVPEKWWKYLGKKKIKLSHAKKLVKGLIKQLPNHKLNEEIVETIVTIIIDSKLELRRLAIKDVFD